MYGSRWRQPPNHVHVPSTYGNRKKLIAALTTHGDHIEDEDMEAAKALVLQEGTDINAVNSDGSTPLFLVRVNNNTS